MEFFWVHNMSHYIEIMQIFTYERIELLEFVVQILEILEYVLNF